MSSSTASAPNAKDPAARPEWRRRLVDAERGLALGLRADSSLFIYLFLLSIVVTSAVVLGMTLLQWALLVLCLTTIVTSELAGQMLRLFAAESQPLTALQERIFRLGSAAIVVMVCGASICIGLMLADRVSGIVGW